MASFRSVPLPDTRNSQDSKTTCTSSRETKPRSDPKLTGTGNGHFRIAKNDCRACPLAV